MNNHKFKTEKEDKRGNIKRFLLAFFAFAIVFGSISAVVILKNNEISLRDIFTNETTASSTDNVEATDFGKKELSGTANILIYCTDSSQTEMYFMALINADMDNRIFNVYPLHSDMTYNGLSYVDILAKDGYKEMISAVEKNEKINVDKYISSNAETFALAINYMDGLEYNINNRIEYRTDEYTLILTEGKQTIKGETLLKYFRYCKTLDYIGYKSQGDVLCAMIDEYINSENVDQGITIYQKLLSKLNSTSDISYIEAAEAMPTLKAFCESERQPSTVILSHVSDN